MLVTQLCPTLCNSMDLVHQAPLSIEFSRQEYWSGFPWASPGNIPNSGAERWSPALQADSLPSEPPGKPFKGVQFSSVAQSCPTLCDPMNHSMPGLLSITNSRSSLKLTSIKSVMPSSHLILYHPLLLLPLIPPSIRVFSNESTLHMR